jgi:hypothetical protein
MVKPGVYVSFVIDATLEENLCSVSDILVSARLINTPFDWQR